MTTNNSSTSREEGARRFGEAYHATLHSKEPRLGKSELAALREEMAYHEAGHVVALAATGIRADHVAQVMIVPNKDFLGGVSYRDPGIARFERKPKHLTQEQWRGRGLCIIMLNLGGARRR